MHYIYLLEDQVDLSWYIGYSFHPTQRIEQHVQHLVITTRHKTALRLIYIEGYLNKNDALGRERFLKSGAGRRFLKKQLAHYLTKKHRHTTLPTDTL